MFDGVSQCYIITLRNSRSDSLLSFSAGATEGAENTSYSIGLPMCASECVCSKPPCHLADYTSYTLLNLDPSHDWTLRESATRTTDEIVAFIKAKLEQHADIAPRVGQLTELPHPD